MKALLGLSAAALALSGCAQTHLPVANVIDVQRISEVESEIKRQLSVYQSKVNAERKTVKPVKRACGNGTIDFDITSVQMNLLTTLETTDSGNLGVTIPISIGTVTPSGSVSHDVSDAQSLVLPLYPVHDPDFTVAPADLTKAAPISDLLTALRAAMIRTADENRVCLYDFDYTASDPTKDAGGTYTIGLTVVDDHKAGLDVKLAIVDIGGSHEKKITTANTLTVKFRQTGIPKKIEYDNKGRPTTPVGEGGGPIVHDGGSKK